MAKNRKKYRRGRRKKGNWFTRMKMWQRVLVCVGGVLICLIGAAGIYVAAKWDLNHTVEYCIMKVDEI